MSQRPRILIAEPKDFSPRAVRLLEQVGRRDASRVRPRTICDRRFRTTTGCGFGWPIASTSRSSSNQ